MCLIWLGNVKSQAKHCILIFQMESKRRTGKIRNFLKNQVSKALVMTSPLCLQLSSIWDTQLKWLQTGLKFGAYQRTKYPFSFLKQELTPCVWLVWLCKTAELRSSLWGWAPLRAISLFPIRRKAALQRECRNSIFAMPLLLYYLPFPDNVHRNPLCLLIFQYIPGSQGLSFHPRSGHENIYNIWQ